MNSNVIRFCRIIVGLCFVMYPLVAGTWLWIRKEKIGTWYEAVGKFNWNLVSGNWDKNPY